MLVVWAIGIFASGRLPFLIDYLYVSDGNTTLSLVYPFLLVAFSALLAGVCKRKSKNTMFWGSYLLLVIPTALFVFTQIYSYLDFQFLDVVGFLWLPIIVLAIPATSVFDGFFISEEAMKAQAFRMDQLSRERVFDELCKLLPHVTAADLLRYAPILGAVIPELKPMLGFDQRSPHHAYDLFTHVAHVVAGVPGDLTLRWAALLHDIGKAVAAIANGAIAYSTGQVINVDGGMTIGRL